MAKLAMDFPDIDTQRVSSMLIGLLAPPEETVLVPVPSMPVATLVGQLRKDWAGLALYARLDHRGAHALYVAFRTRLGALENENGNDRAQDIITSRLLVPAKRYFPCDGREVLSASERAAIVKALRRIYANRLFARRAESDTSRNHGHRGRQREYRPGRRMEAVLIAAERLARDDSGPVNAFHVAAVLLDPVNATSNKLFRGAFGDAAAALQAARERAAQDRNAATEQNLVGQLRGQCEELRLRDGRNISYEADVALALMMLSSDSFAMWLDGQIGGARNGVAKLQAALHQVAFGAVVLDVGDQDLDDLTGDRKDDAPKPLAEFEAKERSNKTKELTNALFELASLRIQDRAAYARDVLECVRANPVLLDEIVAKRESDDSTEIAFTRWPQDDIAKKLGWADADPKKKLINKAVKVAKRALENVCSMLLARMQELKGEYEERRKKGEDMPPLDELWLQFVNNALEAAKAAPKRRQGALRARQGDVG
ncbi:hypothetical protein [Elioraea sp.]|uniref:hypothetical protein n=1 Tax=Elioraea sp. TaxID=2185103 RepID=UPI0025B87282|nr:hypothetical protein [Elioraea sp.]